MRFRIDKSMALALFLGLALMLSTVNYDCGDDDDGHHKKTCIDADKDGFFKTPGCGPIRDCDDANPNVWTACGACVDADADGWFVGCDQYATINGPDCDDANPDVYPDAPELCDQIDNQCPGDAGYGIYDEGCVPGMVMVPAGCFDMGDHFDLPGGDDQLPVHHVCITHDYYMDLHEVTNAEYALCVAATACSLPASLASATHASYYGNAAYNDFPVIWVDWARAKAYCQWAGKRLATEAEWEYAARGGLDGARYSWGDTISGADANYSGSGDPWDNDTSPIEYYPPNGYGLFDMDGNVTEWVNDWSSYTYYAESPVNDPPGPASGTYRVIRGFCWYSLPQDVSVAFRIQGSPTGVNSWYNGIGIRCAKD